MSADLVILGAIVLVAGTVGVAVGMLLSRPLMRLADRAFSQEDEDSGDGAG